MENRSSLQGYLGKKQYPTKRMSALRRWMGRTGRLGKISMPRSGKDEAEPAEQHSPPWWMPHGCHCGPRTQSPFVSSPPDMTPWKTVKLPKECVSISYHPGRFIMVSEVIRLVCGKLCHLYCTPESVDWDSDWQGC